MKAKELGINMRKRPKLIGDVLDEQFKRFGITTVVQAMEKLTKQSCGCGNRKEKLNALHRRLKQLGQDIPTKLRKKFDLYS